MIRNFRKFALDDSFDSVSDFPGNVVIEKIFATASLKLVRDRSYSSSAFDLGVKISASKGTM